MFALAPCHVRSVFERVREQGGFGQTFDIQKFVVLISTTTGNAGVNKKALALHRKNILLLLE